ncbi:MAG: S8 family serine peptidase [Phycisphaerales bacterium]
MRSTRRASLIVRAAGLAAAVSCASLALAGPGAIVDAVEHNGVLYPVRKLADGSKLYRAGEAWLTIEQLRAHVAAQPARIVTRALAERLSGMAPGAPIEVTIVLRNQPSGPIGREVWAGVTPRVEEIAARMRELGSGGAARLSMPRAVEGLVPVPPLGAADAAEMRALAEERDDVERDARILIAQQIAGAVAPQQDALAGFVGGLGGAVTARVSVANIIGASLPAGRIAELAAHPLVAVVDFNHPGEPELDISALALGVNTGFWAAGITGGTFDAGILDTGVQQNHPALSSHTYLSNLGVSDTQTHGTLMAGIMASTDAVNRGMAFGLDKIAVALAGDINTSMPGMAYIASTGEPEACNYSFGNGTANVTDYGTTDQFFDGVIDTFGYMVAKSTGNGGFGSGAPTITHPAPAFNLMAAANINDLNTAARLDDRISSSSSRGPTAGGRKKPDIGAPGTNIQSCNVSWATNPWAGCTGTSCAAPHVGAAVILLFDAGVQNIAAAKAILINTSDAMDDLGTSATGDDVWVPGSLWNRRYGWGHMNLASAYTHRADAFTDSVADEPENADFRLYAGTMFQHEKATLTWQRKVAYNGATFPTQIESHSDLDLTGWREDTNASVASSVSAIDNVEQIGAPSDGFVVLKVEAAGLFDPDVPTQAFALATQENFTARSGPAFAPQFGALAPVAPGATFQVTATINNTGDLDGHGVQASLSGAAVVSGANPAILGTIGDGQGAQVQWTVQAPVVAGPFQLTINVSSSSYGETFTGQGGATVQVGGCYPDCTGDGALSVADFGCFQGKYVLGDLYADCNGSGGLTVADFGCFQGKYVLGCP